jgi:hypothetical protein
MQVGSVVLPVSLDISQLPNQAKKASSYLKDLKLPGVANVGKQIDSAISSYESASKVVGDFIEVQTKLSVETAKAAGTQAKSFLSLQNVAGKFGGYMGGVFKGLDKGFTSFQLPALAGIAGLGVAFTGLAPLISGLILPMLGLGGGLGGLAGGFLNAQLAAVNFGGRGLVKQIKLIRELLPVTSQLKGSLRGLTLPADLFNTISKFSTSITGAITQVKTFKAQIDGLANNLVTNAGGILGGAGAFAAPGAAPVGNPVTAAFDANKGVAEYVKFEQSMSMFTALANSSGASAKQIKAVVEESKRLGAATSKSAVEAAALAGGLTRLGFTAEQVSQSMGGVVATSEATAEPLEAVGRIIASTINQFQLSANDAGKVGDVLGTMANVTATSIIDMGEAMKYVGGTAKLANQSLEDTAISIGILANAGLNGGMAGTALNAALVSLQKSAASAKSETDLLNKSISLTGEELVLLQSLNKGGGLSDAPTSASAKDMKGRALAQLGLSKEDLLDSNGNLKSMLEIIPEIRAGVEELSKTASGTANVPILLDALFGEQGGRAIKALMSSTQEDLNALKTTASEASGFSSEVSEQMLSGISGTLSKLLSASQGISLVVGEFFAPMIQKVAKEITELMNAFLGMPPILQKLTLAGAMIMPFMIAYWNYLGFQRRAVQALAATKWLLVQVQTEEGRQTIKNTVIDSVAEAKKRSLAVATLAQATATKVLKGELSVLAAAQMGLAKVLDVVKASYKEWFSTVTYQINTIGSHAKGIGQFGLVLTNLNVGQLAVNASTAVGNGIQTASVVIFNGLKASIASLTGARLMDAAATTKVTLAQTIQKGATATLAAAKLALALITGKLSTANLGLAATYGVLMARLAVVAAAFMALKAAWGAATAGMAEASKLKKAADNIDKITGSSQVLGKEAQSTEGIIGRFFNSLSDGQGPITAIQKALGLATNASVAFRREMEATEKVAQKTNAMFDDGMEIINKYGLAQIEQGDKARLGADGIKAFVDEASDQVRKINETIVKLQEQEPVNEEAKQALKVQIDLLTKQSGILQSRIQLIQSDTDLSKENAEAQEAIIIQLEELQKKYKGLEKAQGFADRSAVLEIERALADQSISAAQAAEKREEAERNSIEARIALNQKALEELERSSEFVPADDRAKLEEEITERTIRSVELRIDAAKKEVEEREKLNAKFMESERAKIDKLESEMSLGKAKDVNAVKAQQVSGGLSSKEAQSKLDQIQVESIQNAIALEEKRLETERGLAQKGLLTRQEFAEKQREIEEKTTELSTELLEKQIDAAQKANEKIFKSFEDRISAQESALGLSNNAQIAQIRQAQLEGTLTQEDAELKLQGVRQQSVEKEKAIAQDKLATIQSLVAQGVISQEDAAKQIASAEKELSDLVISGLDEQLAARDKLKEARLNDIAEIAAREGALAGLDTQLEVNVIKQAQADKVLTVEEAERQINAIRDGSLEADIKRQQQQLAQITQLREQGILTEEEYGDKRVELERSVADIQSQLIESQIQEQQRLSQERVALLEAELKKTETLQDIANNKRTASLKQALNNGAISEEQFSQQLSQLKVSEVTQAIASEQRKLAQVSQLLAEGLITAKEAAERRLEIEKGISEKEISLIDAKEAARKAAADAAIKSMEDAAARQAALAEKASLKDELAIKSSGGSEEDVAAKLAESSKRATEASIRAARQQMAEVSRLQAQGLMSAKEAAERRLALEKEVLKGSIDLVDHRRAAEQKLTDEILKQSEKRTQAQQDDLDRTTTAGVTAIKARELAGSISAENAAKEIAKIEMETQRQQLANLQSQLADIASLRSRGVLTAEQAADKERELNKQVADANLSLIEKQIDAKKRAADEAVAAIDKTLLAARRSLELGSARSDMTSNRLGAYGANVDATAGLMSATNNLENQRLEFQIKLAESKGKEVLAEQLKAEQFQRQYEQLQQTQEVQANQLMLSQRQKEIEMEREAIQARIALLEAQAEFAKAKASGASAEELAYLKEMVNLRDEALSWTQEAIAGQEEINRLEEESLRVQQQAEKEAAAQARVLDLQGKLLDDQAGARGIINKELKEAQKLQQGLEKDFQMPADATYVGFESLSDKLKGAKVGQISRPDMGTKPSTNVSGDIIGANTITINVTSEGNNAPVDIKQAVMSAMGDVTTQLRTRLGG